MHLKAKSLFFSAGPHPAIEPRISFCRANPAHSKRGTSGRTDQTGRHRGLRNNTEVCGPKIRAGIGELRVIEGIVELRAERQLCVFAEAPTVVVLPIEKSVLNCPGPLMML